MNDEAIGKFAQDLRGPVIGRNHPEYEEARKLYNAMIDKRPLLIARCADVADVIDLPDAAIDAHVAHAAKLPSALSGMHIYPVDGAVHRQKKDAMPTAGPRSLSRKP
jgi:hypothetical protein